MAKTKPIYLFEGGLFPGKRYCLGSNSPAFIYNCRAIKLHERLGFQQEGRIRRAVYTKGQYFDNLVYGLTKEEFAAKHGNMPI